MKEEEKIFAGKFFCPGHPDLKAIKLRCHNLCSAYNATLEDETEKRNAIVHQIFGDFGEGSFVQGPIQIHYGTHTHIGKSFFGNFNLTIQDDTPVTIGDRCNFGPNVTIVTPMHPIIAEERRVLKTKDGREIRVLLRKTRHHRQRLLVRRKRRRMPGRDHRAITVSSVQAAW